MPPAAASLLLLALLFLAAQPRTAHATSADHDDEQRPLTAGGGVDDWNNLTAFARVSWGPTAAPLSAVVAGACARAESGAAAAAIDPRHWLVGSDDVGVTPCRVQVRLRAAPGPPNSTKVDDVEVTALTFWRVVLSGRRLFVRGFYAYHNFVVQHHKHLVDPDAWVSLRFFIRSPHTGLMLPLPGLSKRSRDAGRTPGNVAEAFPMRAVFDLPDDLFALAPDGSQQPELSTEFLVVVEGAYDVCTVVADVAPAAVAAATATPKAASDYSDHGAAANGANDDKVNQSTLSQSLPGTEAPPETSAFVLSPTWAPAREVVPLLLWHMRWHVAFGIQRYFVYVTHDAVNMALDPRVQALVCAGRLTLVLWESTPLLLSRANYTEGWGDHFSWQHVYYNHALLALWPDTSIILSADPDEFLFTATPMTVPEIMRTCRPEGKPSRDAAPAGTLPPVLTIPRVVSWCVKDCHHLSAGDDPSGTAEGHNNSSHHGGEFGARKAYLTRRELDMWLDTESLGLQGLAIGQQPQWWHCRAEPGGTQRTANQAAGGSGSQAAAPRTARRLLASAAAGPSAAAGGGTPSQAPHPLRHYGMLPSLGESIPGVGPDQLRAYRHMAHNPKAMVSVAAVDHVSIHGGDPMPGAAPPVHLLNATACAGWLHVVNLFGLRLPGIPGMTVEEQREHFMIPRQYMWPMDQ